jgi:RHS repeat-associated protein
MGTENDTPILELNASGSLVTRDINGPGDDNTVATENSSGTVNWNLTDYQGSTRLVINNSATVLSSITYDANGNVVSGTLSGGPGYTGQRQDALTGLISMGNGERDENPKTGRFNQTDSGGFDTSGPNLYTYAKNAPTDGTDPSGDDVFVVGDKTKKAVMDLLQQGLGMEGAGSDPIAVPSSKWGGNQLLLAGPPNPDTIEYRIDPGSNFMKALYPRGQWNRRTQQEENRLKAWKPEAERAKNSKDELVKALFLALGSRASKTGPMSGSLRYRDVTAGRTSRTPGFVVMPRDTKEQIEKSIMLSHCSQWMVDSAFSLPTSHF